MLKYLKFKKYKKPSISGFLSNLQFLTIPFKNSNFKGKVKVRGWRDSD
jgi:hypothetical protein